MSDAAPEASAPLTFAASYAEAILIDLSRAQNDGIWSIETIKTDDDPRAGWVMRLPIATDEDNAPAGYPKPYPKGYAEKAAAAAIAELTAYAAAKRFAVETGGIVVGGASVATDRDSQAMIGNAFAYVTASGAGSVRFKASSGWVTLSADQVKALALAVGAHVQAAFAAEDDLDAAINASPPTVTTAAQIDAAAWPPNG
ncbi:DUF4376 domain-containing protein [Methylobacterium sp. A49B]